MSDKNYTVSSVNPAEIYYRAKAAWMRNEAPKRNITDLFFDIRILLLTLAFLAMGLLSSSHTVEAFSHNAPFALALVSPLAFELYLIASTLTGRTVQRDMGTRITQVLIFIVAVIANGASGWQQATMTSGEGMLTIYQIMSLIAAPIVPLATMSIGHQLALSIQARQTADKIAEAWKLAEAGVFYRALYTAYNTQGVPPLDARKLAQADAQGYLGMGRVSSVSRLPATVSTVSFESTKEDAVHIGTAQKEDGTGQNSSGSGTLADKAYAMLVADPSLYDMSVRELAERTGITKNHWVIAKRKVQQLQDTQPIEVQKRS
jgi:hypothetical protein